MHSIQKWWERFLPAITRLMLGFRSNRECHANNEWQPQGAIVLFSSRILTAFRINSDRMDAMLSAERPGTVRGCSFANAQTSLRGIESVTGNGSGFVTKTDDQRVVALVVRQQAAGVGARFRQHLRHAVK